MDPERIRPIQNQRGISLIGVLVLAATLSAVAVALVSMFERLQHENSVLHGHSETMTLARYVKNVLVQPTLCQAVFTDGSGQPLVWPNFTQGQSPTYDPAAQSFMTVPRIWVASAGNAHVAAVTGQVFSPGTFTSHPPPPGKSAPVGAGLFRLTDMYLRRSYQDLDQSTRPDGSMVDPADGKTYVTVTSQLVLQFDYCTGSTPCSHKALAAPNRDPTLANVTIRTIPVTVAVDPTTSAIHSCYQPGAAQAVSKIGGPTTVYTGFGQECLTAAAAGCTKTYTLAGYDGYGAPQFACHKTCQVYGKGPAGSSGYNSGDPGSDGMALLMSEASGGNAKMAFTESPHAPGESDAAPGFQLNPTSPPPNPSVDAYGNYLATQGTYSDTTAAPGPCAGAGCIAAGSNPTEPAAP